MLASQKELLKEESKMRQNMPSISVDLVSWYQEVFRNRSRAKKTPLSVPQYKQSHPYRLLLSKLQGHTLNKKNNNADLYIAISGFLFVEPFEILGTPFSHQWEYSMGRGERWDGPLSIYFHSRIDKNYEKAFLLLKWRALEIKDGVVEQAIEIGVSIIKNPFSEEDNKQLNIYKDLSEIEFAISSKQTKSKVLSGASPTTATYSLESMLELKKITKFLPQNALFSYQLRVSGLQGNRLPREVDDCQVSEGKNVQLFFNYLQVHVSERFEQDLIAFCRKNFPSEKNLDIKTRRIVIGYHNQYLLVSPSTRKLQLLKKETFGQTCILIYQGLKEGETIKVPFYYQGDESAGILMAGLLYEVGSRELQVGTSFFLPKQGGEELNTKMITGSLLGAVSLTATSFPTAEAPILIAEYHCNFSELSATARQEGFGSAKQITGKGYINQQALQEQRQRLKKEIEKERFEILKEKEELDRLKLEKESQFQVEFERKFEKQKEGLYRRQQLLQSQYREQVEREIREKFQLEQEVKKLVERMKSIEQAGMKRSGETSYQESRKEPSSGQASPQDLPPIRQRMDPAYIIQPQNPLPVRRARQLLDESKQVPEEIIRRSEETINWASRFTFTFTSLIWNKQVNAPRSISLVIRFFNQPPFRTENLEYQEIGEGGYHKLFKQSKNDSQPSFSFRIDPSQYQQPALIQKDLTRYLQRYAAIIEVFCAQTHLYIGQLNLRLSELLRGNREEVMAAKQVNIVRIRDRLEMGVIHVLMANKQTECREIVSVKHQSKMADVRKKIVSTNPIRIPEEAVNREKTVEPIRGRQADLSRQELRIKKFKEQQAGKHFAASVNQFNQLQQAQKGVVLQKINSYKIRKIDEFLRGAYEQLLSERIQLSAHYGQAVTFPFLFTNISPSPASFHVAIQAVESVDDPELHVINSGKEWRYFVHKNKYAEPKRYDLVGEGGGFFLQSGESLPLVFKFLSFEVSRQQQQLKNFNVTICKEDNQWIAGGFSLTVNMHQPIIHHSYVLYEPGEQLVDLIVPVVYSDTEGNSPKKLHLTLKDPLATAIWINSYEIMVRLPTPKVMQKLHFNLLLYRDEYLCELTENWLIEVYAYEGVCSSFRSDYSTRFKLTLPWSAVPSHLGLLSLSGPDNCLQLYSSNPSLSFKQEAILLDSDRRESGSYEIWCQLLGTDNSLKTFEVTCVSAEESELLYGWAITVYPYIPRT